MEGCLCVNGVLVVVAGRGDALVVRIITEGLPAAAPLEASAGTDVGWTLSEIVTYVFPCVMLRSSDFLQKGF